MTKQDDTKSTSYPTKTTIPQSAQALPSINNYKILDTLGEGGFGVVYLAQQSKPIKRKVALKVIKPGMDTKAVIARFEAERQALAMMNHPNVAKVIDAGTTDQGRPYFVMELIKGIPITEHCDRQKFNITDRLNLFIDVCEAVQHAHHKGIIHRDIKPSNILVEYRNNKSIVKVIDFGVAKAVAHRLTEKTIFTQHGQLIGTPAYMSPEQAEMTSQDIDTRTDIYSLGVVLYQLLTGVTPFDTKSLLSAGWHELQRVIREQEPQKPSTRLSEAGIEKGSDSAAIARNRKTSQATLSSSLRGDLDWVTIKALEKDRSMRYATATELADDIRRHLRDEPVLASPPSSIYRLKKFIKRNKGWATSIGAIATTLIIATIVSISFAISEQKLRHTIEKQNIVIKNSLARETTANEKITIALHNTEDARLKMQEQRDFSKQVQVLLTDMLNGVGPYVSLGRDTTLLREIMYNTAVRIKSDMTDQPLVQASLFQTICNVYIDLGKYETALPFAEQALQINRKLYGNEHVDIATSLDLLSQVQLKLGNYEDGEKLCRQALAMRRKLLGNQHPMIASSISNLASELHRQKNYAEADILYHESLSMLRSLYGDKHLDIAEVLSNLGSNAFSQRKFAKAEQFHREALVMHEYLAGDKNPTMATYLNNLANDLTRQNKYAEAENIHRRTLALRRKLLGDEHPHVLRSLDNLADSLIRQKKYAESIPYWREALNLQRKISGDVHKEVANSLNNLATAYYFLGKFSEAEGPYREALAMRRKLFNDNDPSVLRSLGNLVDVLKAQGKFTQAKPYAAKLLNQRRERAEKPDASVNDINVYTWDLLTVEPKELRDPAAALPMAKKAVEKTNYQDAGVLDTLALAQQMNGDVDGAVKTEKTALALLPPGPSFLRAAIEPNLIMFLLEQKSYSQAEPLLLSMHKQLINQADVTAKQKQESIQQIVELYDAWHTTEPGEGYNLKADEWRTKLN